MINDVEHFFPVSVGRLYVFFRKMSVQVLCPYLNQVVCFLILSCMSSLYILDINLFIVLLTHQALVALIVRNMPAMQQTCVWSLGWDDPLEKGMAVHFRCVFLPGEFHEHKGLKDYSLWGHKELDKTEWLTLSLWAFLVAQMVKNLPILWETWVQSLGQEDLLEKGMPTHSSILAWKIPWTEEPGGLQFMGSQRVGHDWATNTFTFNLTVYVICKYLLLSVDVFSFCG